MDILDRNTSQIETLGTLHMMTIEMIFFPLSFLIN